VEEYIELLFFVIHLCWKLHENTLEPYDVTRQVEISLRLVMSQGSKIRFRATFYVKYRELKGPGQ